MQLANGYPAAVMPPQATQQNNGAPYNSHGPGFQVWLVPSGGRGAPFPSGCRNCNYSGPLSVHRVGGTESNPFPMQAYYMLFELHNTICDNMYRKSNVNIMYCIKIASLHRQLQKVLLHPTLFVCWHFLTCVCDGPRSTVWDFKFQMCWGGKAIIWISTM